MNNKETLSKILKLMFQESGAFISVQHISIFITIYFNLMIIFINHHHFHHHLHGRVNCKLLEPRFTSNVQRILIHGALCSFPRKVKLNGARERVALKVLFWKKIQPRCECLRFDDKFQTNTPFPNAIAILYILDIVIDQKGRHLEPFL